jgi:hypothetical protein
MTTLILHHSCLLDCLLLSTSTSTNTYHSLSTSTSSLLRVLSMSFQYPTAVQTVEVRFKEEHNKLLRQMITELSWKEVMEE